MERNRRRDRLVSDDAMQKMAERLRPPTFEEGFSKITMVRVVVLVGVAVRVLVGVLLGVEVMVRVRVLVGGTGVAVAVLVGFVS